MLPDIRRLVSCAVACVVLSQTACESEPTVDCGAGRRVTIGGHEYCVYRTSTADCPLETTTRVAVGAHLVCTDDRDATRAADLPPEVCEGCGDPSSECTGGRVGCGPAESPVCTDLGTDPASCGACGHACPQNEVCRDGSCHCDAPWSQCGSECRDLASDALHCGACGARCRGDEQCTDAQCCPEGTVNCGQGCTSLAMDDANCGTCGVVCPPNRVCMEGVCSTRHSTCGNALELELRDGLPTLWGESARHLDSSPEGCSSDGDLFYVVRTTRTEIVQLSAESAVETTLARLDGACGAPSARCVPDECAGTASMVADALGSGRNVYVLELAEDGEVNVGARHVPVDTARLRPFPAGDLVLDADTSGSGRIDRGACGAGNADVYWFATCPDFAGGRLTATTCDGTAPSFPTLIGLLRADAAPVCVPAGTGCANGSTLDVELRAGAGVYALVVQGSAATDRGRYHLTATRP